MKGAAGLQIHVRRAFGWHRLQMLVLICWGSGITDSCSQSLRMAQITDACTNLLGQRDYRFMFVEPSDDTDYRCLY